jgi:hypothetical protein
MAKKFDRRAYHKEYMRRRYQVDPVFREKQRARNTINKRRYRAQVDDVLSAFHVRGCMACQESDTACLVAHHLDPTGKEFNLGDARRLNMSARRVASELTKCVCLCSNCHMKLHAEHICLLGVEMPQRQESLQLPLF